MAISDAGTVVHSGVREGSAMSIDSRAVSALQRQLSAQDLLWDVMGTLARSLSLSLNADVGGTFQA